MPQESERCGRRNPTKGKASIMQVRSSAENLVKKLRLRAPRLNNMNKETRRHRRILRHKRVRAKITGNALKPRLVVFRSNKHLYIQLIDDEKNKVLAAVSDLKIRSKKKGVELAKVVAHTMAEKAREHDVKKIVFDRGGYKYHGQIKVLAEELRAQGITF